MAVQEKGKLGKFFGPDLLDQGRASFKSDKLKEVTLAFPIGNFKEGGDLTKYATVTRNGVAFNAFGSDAQVRLSSDDNKKLTEFISGEIDNIKPDGNIAILNLEIPDELKPLEVEVDLGRFGGTVLDDDASDFGFSKIIANEDEDSINLEIGPNGDSFVEFVFD